MKPQTKGNPINISQEMVRNMEYTLLPEIISDPSTISSSNKIKKTRMKQPPTISKSKLILADGVAVPRFSKATSFLESKAKGTARQRNTKQKPANKAMPTNPAALQAAVLEEIFELVTKVQFADYSDDGEVVKITQKHYIVGVVKEILKIVKTKKYGLCLHNESIYVYTGQYWKLVDQIKIRTFLWMAAVKMGVDPVIADYYEFRLKLYKQFLASAHLSAPVRNNQQTLVNLQNGTFEITATGNKLREFRASDFLTYQLPFKYNAKAKAPIFDKYLKRVLPEKELQRSLSEFMGYVFAKNLKLEKCLLLYGTGANGKSVFFDIINALLGRENISNFSLSDLGAEYNRALIADKLLNYGSEITKSLDSDRFKQLASGEAVQARLKYQNAVTITDYARLCFNCNELPASPEQTEAYFRRFLIIPFNVTIPETERDPTLAGKITGKELSGVFNWVLSGLKSILKNRRFADSQIIKAQLEAYKLESDTVYQFISDANYKPSTHQSLAFSLIFDQYRKYCQANSFRALSSIKFSKKMREHGFTSDRGGKGGQKIIFIEKKKLGFKAPN